jgi:hypothetical protein
MIEFSPAFPFPVESTIAEVISFVSFVTFSVAANDTGAQKQEAPISAARILTFRFFV